MPVVFGEKFHLTAQQLGLQSLGLMIGLVLGEQVGGPLSDYLIIWFADTETVCTGLTTRIVSGSHILDTPPL
jgi:hypothetical protein